MTHRATRFARATQLTDTEALLNAPATVLVVDDAPSDLRLLVESLKDAYKVKVATSGTRALELARGPERPDLILLDVVMPGMDGYAVCQQIKADPATRGIPVIFISVQDDVEDEARGLGLGAIDYILKPIRPPIVQARVKNHIALKRSLDLLEHMTTVDHLTGVSNRRGFDEYLGMEWHRAMRTGEPLSLLAADLDHFKPYNDHYGHPAGDACLGAVALALRESVARITDMVARCGGEEFGCILPDTNVAGALAIAQDMRRRAAGLRITHAHSACSEYVSISIGVATQTPEPGSSPRQLIDRADCALYEAKAAGRNRVVVWGGQAEAPG
jgi:diguanylate cyclase (GGDEF)-like protein